MLIYDLTPYETVNLHTLQVIIYSNNVPGKPTKVDTTVIITVHCAVAK